MIRTAVAAIATLFLLSACQEGAKPTPSGLTVENAWVRLPPVPDRPGAAYFSLRNNGPASVLTGIASPKIERIELHDSQMHDGMVHMMPTAEVAIAQGTEVDFRPGGKHAMLFGMDKTLKAGDNLPLTFTLRDGHKVEVQARLVAAGDQPPHGE